MSVIEDDFSPEEAFRLFPAPTPAFRNTEALFRSSKQFDVTNAFFHELVQPHSEPDVELWDEQKPSISFPILLSILGLCTIVTNGIFLFSFFAYRRVRTGSNLMLLNIAVADLVFVFAIVPVAILNYAARLNVGTGPDSSEYPSATHLHVCRFVHYVILVSVYVSNYTIVVTCVFIFFDGLLRVRRKEHFPSSTTIPRMNNGKPDASLTNTHAVLSCAVVWIAFVASHLNFLVQRDRPMFEEPLICKHTEDRIDAVNLRTHWMTFMTCAFLIPLLVVGTLSLMIIQRGGGVRNADACGISLSRSPRLLALTRKIKPSIKNTYCEGRFALRETNPVAARRYRHHNEGGHQFTNQTYTETVLGPELVHQPPECFPAPVVEGIAPCPCPEHAYSTLKRADKDTLQNTTPPLQGIRHFENGESTISRKPPHNHRRQPQETDEEVLESVEGSLRDARTRRDIMIVILVSIVVRFLCWLPMLIIMLMEVFGTGEGPLITSENGHDSEEGSKFYHVARIFAICLVFVAACVNAFVYNYVSADYRRINVRMFSACLCCSKKNHEGH